jgi:hypothetical protein
MAELGCSAVRYGAGVDVMSRGYSDVVCCVVLGWVVLPSKVMGLWYQDQDRHWD